MASILLVEDNTLSRDSMMELIQEYGYEVRAAANGSEALALAKEKTPDLVLCDLRMPDMTGYDVFNGLRNRDETKAVPVIFLTASAEISEVKKGLAMGAWGYIIKPFQIAAFFETVEKCLGGAPPQPIHRYIL